MSLPAADASLPLVKLATSLATKGQTREAVLAARRALATQPTDPALLSNLGSLFSACQDFNSALICFQGAVAKGKESASYRYNLATAQRALGDLAAAEKSCDEAIRLNPRHCAAYWLRAGLRTQTRSSNHVPQIESQLAAGYARAEDKALLSYALAKELEDIGEHAKSFEHLRVGAQTYRSLLRYDVENDIKVIESIIAAHTAENLRGVSPGYADAAPIFVVGMPRSGTTLVERIIQSHSDVVSVGERNDFALELVRATNAAANGAKLDRDQRVRLSLRVEMSALGQRYVEATQPEDAGNRRVLDKMPINYLYCGLIHAALPNAKIVSLRRNALDSCYAAYKTFLTGPYGFSYDLDELGRYYAAYHALVEHWRATLPAQSYLEIHYEDLVTDFEGQARRLLEFLGLSWEQSVTGFFNSAAPSSTASAAQVRQPVYATSVGKWQNYREQLAPLARLLASRGLAST